MADNTRIEFYGARTLWLTFRARCLERGVGSASKMLCKLMVGWIANPDLLHEQYDENIPTVPSPKSGRVLGRRVVALSELESGDDDVMEDDGREKRPPLGP